MVVTRRQKSREEAALTEAVSASTSDATGMKQVFDTLLAREAAVDPMMIGQVEGKAEEQATNEDHNNKDRPKSLIVALKHRSKPQPASLRPVRAAGRRATVAIESSYKVTAEVEGPGFQASIKAEATISYSVGKRKAVESEEPPAKRVRQRVIYVKNDQEVALKRISVAERPAVDPKSLMVSLKVPTHRLKTFLYFWSYDGQPNIKKTIVPKDYFTNDLKFKFGHNPYDFTTYSEPKPSEAKFREVFQLLQDYHKKEHQLDFYADQSNDLALPLEQGPFHASHGISVDAIVKTILSQSTGNEKALRAHEMLRVNYKYKVDGYMVRGNTPNYHSMRTSSLDKLKKVLMPSGIFNKRAHFIHSCLNKVFERNVMSLPVGTAPQIKNRHNAPDFVPGLLSLDYLNGLSQQELFDALVEFEGVGVKTACCILAFNFHLPVFAVDTHVIRMVKWLGLVPSDCDNEGHRDKACMYLDLLIPDDIKYALHQAFWHHGQKCLKCKAATSENTKGWDETVCPIDHLIDRSRILKGRKIKTESTEEEHGQEGTIDRSTIGGNTLVEENDEMPTKLKEKTPRVKSLPWTVAETNMNAEDAEINGYVLIEMPLIDDNFGAARTNLEAVTRKVWVKKEIYDVQDDDAEILEI